MAARPCSTRASRSARPTPAPSGASSPSTRCALFTAPTAFRAIKREDPEGKLIKNYDLSHFRTLFLAGERSDPPTLEWAEQHLKVPVIDHWWQTETGWAICANCMGIEALPVKHGSPTKPAPGWDVRVLDGWLPRGEARRHRRARLQAAAAAGLAATLWNADERYVQSISRPIPATTRPATPATWTTDGYVYVMARTDDVINVAGHRLSTGAMEEVLAAHPDVAECAVIGVADELKGQVPLGFVVLKAGVNRDHAHIVQGGRADGARPHRPGRRLPAPPPW